jgi:hypothetical protein
MKYAFYYIDDGIEKRSGSFDTLIGCASYAYRSIRGLAVTRFVRHGLFGERAL